MLGAGEEEEAGVSDQLLPLQDTGADRSTDLGLRPTPVCLLVESPGPATCPLPLPSTAVVEEREAEERGSPKEASEEEACWVCSRILLHQLFSKCNGPFGPRLARKLTRFSQPNSVVVL